MEFLPAIPYLHLWGPLDLAVGIVWVQRLCYALQLTRVWNLPTRKDCIVWSPMITKGSPVFLYLFCYLKKKKSIFCITFNMYKFTHICHCDCFLDCFMDLETWWENPWSSFPKLNLDGMCCDSRWWCRQCASKNDALIVYSILEPTGGSNPLMTGRLASWKAATVGGGGGAVTTVAGSWFLSAMTTINNQFF